MRPERSRPLTARAAAAFWAPLAATWLMMSVEGPFIAAVIARLADPTANLAAYGVAFTLAWICEAPIIMIMSAATALVRDRQAFHRLRRFTYALNALVTCAMVVLLSPPVFDVLVEGLIGLPREAARLTHVAAVLLLPWPAAIGYRRFYQGVMIRHGFPRGVAYGTVVRVSAMALAALGARRVPGLPGASVGALALSAGVVAEAVAARLMASGVVRHLLDDRNPLPAGANSLTTAGILRFYYPLALTPLLALAVNPLITFFLGHSRRPLESLAVFPVVLSLTFVFRSGGIALQETTIALIGDRLENLRVLERLGAWLAAILGGALTLVAVTPLSRVWFEQVAGLPPGLAGLAIVPLRILCLAPALEVMMSLQRSLLVAARRTTVVTVATVVEVAGIMAGLAAGIAVFDVVGTTAAAASLLTGRVAANLFLYPLTLGTYRPGPPIPDPAGASPPPAPAGP